MVKNTAIKRLKGNPDEGRVMWILAKNFCCFQEEINCK